jgi:hypothetical protein
VLLCLSDCSKLGAAITRPSSLKILWEDMVKMEDVNNATILYNLRERFLCGDIYTNVGRILISINPFDWNTSEVFFTNEWATTFKEAPIDEPVRCDGGRDRSASVSSSVHDDPVWPRRRWFLVID